MPRGRRRPEDIASLEGLGLAIGEMRRRRGMMQIELAFRSGLTAESMNRIERAKAEAHWGTLRRICQALEIPLADLIALAEELAPGRGGGWWRRRTRKLKQPKSPSSS